MPNKKRPKVYRGSELPSADKKSAIKSNLKRNPSKPISVINSGLPGIKTPKIEISGTNVGGGKFTRSANRPRSKAPTGDPIKTVQTTAKNKKINYNLEPTNTKSMPDQTISKMAKITMEEMKGKLEPNRTSTEGNVYGR